MPTNNFKFKEIQKQLGLKKIFVSALVIHVGIAESKIVLQLNIILEQQLKH